MNETNSKWKKVKIGDFLTERIGRYKPDDPKITALKRIEKINFNGEIYLADKSSRTDMIIVKDGDLIISGINVAKGAIAVYKGKDDVCATIHYSSYIFDENKINIEYFQWFLKSESFLKLISEQVKGGIKTEIKSKHILPIEISLPNLEIQQDIVEKLNQRLSRINIIALKNTYRSGNITSLRQQILQDAITGKLSEKWRRDNSNIESAEVLLEKIKAEKERLVKEGKIRKQKPLPTITENEIPFEIPEGWVWCRLGEVIEYSENLDIHRYLPHNTIVNYVDIESIDNTNQIIREVKQRSVDELSTRARRTLKKGYILYSTVRPYLKNIAVIDQELENFIGSTGFNVFRPLQINLRYVFNYLLTPYVNETFKELMVGFNSPSITNEQFEKILVPLPPLAEQHYIVERIESLFAKLGSIKDINTENQTNIDLLNQVILKEMFEE